MSIIGKLWRAVTRWRFLPPPDNAYRLCGLIVAHSWSRRKDGTPGQGNKLMARTTEHARFATGLDVFPQEEVAQAMEHRDLIVGIAGGSKDGRSTLKWDTYAVAKIQADYCRANNIRGVIVVAHPLHMGRALWTYQKLGLYARPARMPDKLEAYQDPALVHVTHRHRWTIPLFAVRELLVRILYVIQGKN